VNKPEPPRKTHFTNLSSFKARPPFGGIAENDWKPHPAAERVSLSWVIVRANGWAMCE
jgi:hypothetical protein